MESFIICIESFCAVELSFALLLQAAKIEAKATNIASRFMGFRFNVNSVCLEKIMPKHLLNVSVYMTKRFCQGLKPGSKKIKKLPPALIFKRLQ